MPNAPRTLYDVARKICHDAGYPWTDPRTGITYPPKRFVVHSTPPSSVGRRVVDPHRVVDTTTNSTIDSYSSKRAATMHAAYLNKYEGKSK
jgi:hypothetical protein